MQDVCCTRGSHGMRSRRVCSSSSTTTTTPRVWWRLELLLLLLLAAAHDAGWHVHFRLQWWL
jgi:hypothetical protein